ncbi:MAG TPA: hypothetical protein DCG79_04850, partial [Clostridiales bacterium]|nr:hypothetical protein [Clostridiales bacterium]
MTKFVVTSAKILSEQKRKEIIAKLGAVETDVTFLVDEALIGGLVISDGDRVLDASVKGKLRAAGKKATGAIQNKPLEHILSSLKEEFSHVDQAKKVTAG